ncbi:MAG: NYN domain-containing protein [Dehalococcoidia bacterium]
MVKFFNRPRKTIRDTRKSKTADEAPPAPPKIEKEPATTTEKTPRTRTRRAPARPPRRDWAAEAASLPLDVPAPKASSQASSESEDADSDANGAAPTKRRRGTRGGRGRKKPGAKVDGVDVEEADALAEPATLEILIARQVSTLEAFAKDVTAAIRNLQQTVGDLQGQVAHRPAMTSHPRVALFVDVPNVIYAAERRNVTLDFGRVLDYFTRDRQLVRASAYAPITDDPQAKLEQQRFVHHFMGHPYRIVTKPLKRFADGSMKANFDIELAIDILTMSDRLDVVVLMSGDGDFRRLVELIASRGVRVEVAAFSETASAELKAVADKYVDIGAELEAFKAQK